MNKKSGLGITHFTINDEYKSKLKVRFERLLNDLKSGESIYLIYADASNSDLNYYLDDIEYGVDASEYLEKIYDLLYPLYPNIHILYFCWNQRKMTNTDKIKYIPYAFKKGWGEVSDLIKSHLLQIKE